MAATARLEAKITANDSEFSAGIARAEQKARTFSSRMQALFRRTPERRAERALTGFIADLGTGNVQGAIAGLTSRISGFGLAAGVGIGVAVESIIKFRQEITQANEADDKLRESLRRPMALQSGFGPEGITKEIDDIISKTDELAKKAGSIGAKLRHFITTNPFTGRNPDEESGRSPNLRADVAAGLKRESQLSEARADAEDRAYEVRKTSLEVSEREGDLGKIQLDYEKKRAQLYLDRGLTKPGRSAVDLFKSAATLRAEAQLSTKEEERKSRVLKDQVELETTIAKIKSLHLPKEQEAVKLAQERVNSLKREQAGETQQERISALTPKILGAETELRDQQFAQFEKSPAQLQRERTIQEQHERELKKFDRQGGLHQPHFDMSGRLIGGIDPATGKQVDVSQPSLLDDLGKHMASPGQMSAFGGSDSFNQFFHPNDAKAASGPQDQKSKDDSNIGDVVDVLEDLGSKMDQYWGEN